MFNLKRYAQNTNDSDFVESLGKNTNITNVRPDLQQELKSTKDNIKNPNKQDIKDEYPTEKLKQDFDYLTNLSYFKLLHDKFGKQPEFQDLVAKLQARRISPADFNRVGDILKKITTKKISPTEYNAISATDIYSVANDWFTKDLPVIQKTISDQQAAKKRVPMRMAFNLQKFKSAQLEMPPAPAAPPLADPMQPPPAEAQPPQSQNVLPVNDVGEFISKIINILSSKNENAFNNAQSEIAGSVSSDFEQEVTSAFDSLREYLGNVEEEEQIASILTSIYGLLPTIQNDTTSEVPPEPLKEPIAMAKSFNLSKYVLNNKPGFQKEAYTNLGDAYLLYGPTEKRICPKLRGKGGGKVGAADVVSEEICRFHCLDGIIIDDNKTVCGEAVWRAHVMDKFSREYVDKDGNIVGGYLNKRFEINRNVPEENKMRLKPGETRKPRPPAWGNTESRLQDMRNKEGQNRGYTPTNEGQPFDWTTDVDQNNVNVEQKERDRREEAMGHQLVQYSKKDEQENDPKVIKKASFNLSKFKIAQVATMESPTAVKCKHCGAKVMMTQHQDGTERCPNCGQPQKPDFSYPHFVTGPGTKEEFASNENEIKEAKKKKTKGCDYKGEHFQYCPWAICSDVDESKKEKCIQDVKKQQREKKSDSEQSVKQAEKWIQDAAEKMEEKGTEGSFTEYCGGKVTDECIEKGMNSDNPKTRQRANFAKNVRKKSFNLKEYKTAQMTPPVGPDNPQSDNLGLSPEFADPANLDNHEAYDLEEGNTLSVALNPGEYDAIFGEKANPATIAKFNEALTKLGQEYSTEISAPNADQNKIDFQVDTSNMPSYMREGLEEDLRSAIDKTMTSTHGLTASASKKKT